MKKDIIFFVLLLLGMAKQSIHATITNRIARSICGFSGPSVDATITNTIAKNTCHFSVPIIGALLIGVRVEKRLELFRQSKGLSSPTQMELTGYQFMLCNIFLLSYWYFMTGDGFIGKKIGLVAHKKADLFLIFFPMNALFFMDFIDGLKKKRQGKK